MISSARNRGVPLRRLLLASAAALIPVLAGCEAGNQAPTLNFHVPTEAATASAGDLLVRNAFVLGAPLGSRLQPGDTASLFFSVLTTGGSDRLVSVSAPGSATSVQLPGGGLAVTTGHPVLLNGPQTEAFLVGLTRKITSGSTLRLVLTFQREGQVTLVVPVMARAAHFVTYGPVPSPTATTTAHKKHHKTTAGATPTPTPSPSAS